MAGVYMAGDFRNGTTFEMDGGVFRVVEFQHVKPGKGAAFVRTKLKNVINGSVLEKTFNPSEKLQGAEIEKKEMQISFFSKDNTEKLEKLDHILDSINQKYGYNSITRAGKMDIQKIVKIKDKKE